MNETRISDQDSSTLLTDSLAYKVVEALGLDPDPTCRIRVECDPMVVPHADQIRGTYAGVAFSKEQWEECVDQAWDPDAPFSPRSQGFAPFAVLVRVANGSMVTIPFEHVHDVVVNG